MVEWYGKGKSMKLEIKKMSTSGDAIAFHNHKTVFVEGCFPGEIIEAELKEEKGHYRAEVKSILRKSPARMRPQCFHTQKCGSCSLMALKYEQQLRIKKDILQENLRKYCGYEEELEDVSKSPEIYHYRNRCNMPVVDRHGEMVNAFYSSGSNHAALIENCPVHDEKIEEIRKRVLAILNKEGYHAYQRKEKNGIRQLVIRGFDEQYQLVLVTGNDKIKKSTVDALSGIPMLVSLFQGINTRRDPLEIMPEELKLLWGKEKIELSMDSYRLFLSPQAFFQLNARQADRIYRDAANMIGNNRRTIIEAYSGIGAISMFLNDKAEKVIGIEIEKKAVEDARENARRNGFRNLSFLCEDASRGIRTLLKKEKADALVVDPPRTGLDPSFLETLLTSRIEQLVYISCNPVTLAKDLHVLQEKYRIEKIQAYDMFPHTAHVETVVLLWRKAEQADRHIVVNYETQERHMKKNK